MGISAAGIEHIIAQRSWSWFIKVWVHIPLRACGS